jgi:hypothetical protein
MLKDYIKKKLSLNLKKILKDFEDYIKKKLSLNLKKILKDFEDQSRP